jgi:hypothetical protein
MQIVVAERPSRSQIVITTTIPVDECGDRRVVSDLIQGLGDVAAGVCDRHGIGVSVTWTVLPVEPPAAAAIAPELVDRAG